MQKHRVPLAGALIGALVLAACSEPRSPTALKPPSLDLASPAVTYSGQATVVRATALGSQLIDFGTEPLPPSGGEVEASLVNASVPGLLSAEVLHGTAVGEGDRSRAEASVAQLTLTVAGNTVAAGFLMTRAEAQCTAAGPVTSGSSELAELVINGQAIAVSGEPNQTITLPNGITVVINEQKTSPGAITVTAVHLMISGVGEVIISSAHADIDCPAPPPPCPAMDFITGGGWIPGPSGAKATFAVAGGLKNGAFWGHLNYIDHGSGGPRVKGTGVTAYSVVDATTRHIEGTAEVNGQPGYTYKVDAADNGEPGRNDVFNLDVTSPTGSEYKAGGQLGGGNIQLHCR
jgi:hypothetical protein